MTYRYLKCPECGFDGWTTRTGTLYCGNCAGDCGRDVSMREKRRQEERPSQEEINLAEANASWNGEIR